MLYINKKMNAKDKLDELLLTAVSDDIKESSYKNYRNITIKLFNIVNKKKLFNPELDEMECRKGLCKVITDFNDIKKFMELPENDFKDNTKKNYVNNVINVIWKIDKLDDQLKLSTKKKKILNDTIKEYWLTLRERIHKNKLNNVIEEEKHITPEEFDKAIANCRKEFLESNKNELYGGDQLNKHKNMKQNLQDYILLMLYRGKYIPPLRNNYATLNIIDENDHKDMLANENYLIKKNCGRNEILINEDKVSKQYGSGIYKIAKNSLLNKYLNQLLFIREQEGKDYLLEYDNGEKMTTNGLTKYLQKLMEKWFNKKISSSQLRHIFITNIDHNTTNAKLDKIAKKMRHSLQTQQMAYKNVKEPKIITFD